ncbi:orotate phosphoribosyltransferase [Lentibacillus salinarum]|uniref:Orotate phosphoribosyltransferase n=1 Tax=Lentibacillus salinarum TaxID=446820 RepID=A0ABW3ZPK5_9BACI
MELSHDVARDLLDIKAVQFSPDDYFTWTSGIKSPIYCDNRLTMAYPAVRDRIAAAFVQLIGHMEQRPDVIAGCATAGIPHAAWVAEKLNLPMVYIRAKAKEHGKQNQIEGKLEPGQRVVVIEDLISTGGSSIQAAQVLKRAGVDVLGILAIFTYGLEVAKQQFQKANLRYRTITDYDEVLHCLAENGSIDTAHQQQLQKWRNQLALI